MQAWLKQELTFVGTLLALSAAIDSAGRVADSAPGAGRARRGIRRGENDEGGSTGSAAFLPAVEASADLACLGAALAALSLPPAGPLPEPAPVRTTGVCRNPE
jgi:hypothetical protein